MDAPGGRPSIVPTNATAVYTAPALMPANSTITVTVFMSSNTTLTTSYTFTLVNPVPTVSSASPSQLLTGGTQTVALVPAPGSCPQTAVTLNGATLSSTYTDYGDMTVQVPVAANASGTLNFKIANPAPIGGASSFSETVQPNSIALTAADTDGTNTGTAELGRQGRDVGRR